MIGSKRNIAFRRLSLITLIAVYFLIFVGGVVRSTGSGMGCPDWPKCFGQWIPPTDISELPDDYKSFYSNYRHEKNVRFAKYLQSFGMEDKAEAIVNDPGVREEADFNVYKTWTEYINRLVGALIGLLIFGTMIGSLYYYKKDRVILACGVLVFVLTGFQGWIGSIVVSTNLMPWMITLHMLIALVIVLMLIYLNFRIRSLDNQRGLLQNKKLLLSLSLACLITLAIQIVLGTQVREAIDVIAAELSYTFRETWISRIGMEFVFHRSFSLLLLGLHGWLVFLILKNRDHSKLARNTGKYVISLLIVEILSGVIMAYFSIPAFIQPIHLVLSTITFGVVYYLYLVIAHSSYKIAAS